MADKLVIGCGYLGKQVAALWQQQGHRVLVTTRSSERAEQFRQQELEPIICDVSNPPELPQVATVVYCVGMDRSSGLSMREVYVDGLRAVLGKLPPPDRFLYVSSTGVYGQAQGEEVDETAETAPIDESGKIVLEAEQLLQSTIPDAIILRFAGIYGPGRLMRGDALKQGQPLAGDPESWLNLIHVDDGAQAVLAAEERGTDKHIYNICDDSPMRRREFFGYLSEQLNAPEPQFTGEPGRRPTNRRILNRKMRDELQVELQFADYRTGINAILEE